MGKELTPQGARLNVHPGEWYFGNEYDSLYTVLGSCVALTAWHPTLKLGGLCHYLLPVQPGHQREQGAEGRYGKTALLLMKQAMQVYAACDEFQLGLFGGSDTLPNCTIGQQNILYAQHWLQDEGLTVIHTDVGGTVSRSLVLELCSGQVNIKHYAL